tara:strand:- start:634 stop:1710 length:1077 start_codon:yes stop_codon:yes gene_type:complete
MINFVKKKFLLLLNILNFSHRHIYKPTFNTAFLNLHSQTDLNFDLISDLEIDDNNYTKSCLVTCVDRKDTFLKSNDFIFESWTCKDKKTYTNNYNFHESHRKKIAKNLKEKKFKFYNKKIFIFPYYSNQFGHFLGENFGGVLFFLNFLKQRNKKEKLLIIPPSKNWKSYFQKNYKNNCLFFSNKFFIKNNIEFTNSQILPKFSVYQNYTIAKNILSSRIENYDYKEKKVFLTSERVEKIINITELIIFLKKKNFLILNPRKTNIDKLFKILNSAKIVISEFASISHNIHISRNKPYFLLMSNDDKKKNLKWYRLTHFYKNFHASLFKPIYCERVGRKELIPYQSQIKVDIKKIKKILN